MGTNRLSGILPVNNETLKLLPEAKPVYEEIFMTRDPPTFHPIIFKEFDEKLVKERLYKGKVGQDH